MWDGGSGGGNALFASVERLLLAYNSGIFYWQYPLKHIKWWSPDPRVVVKPASFEINESRWESLNKEFTVTTDSDFEQVDLMCMPIGIVDDDSCSDDDLIPVKKRAPNSRSSSWESAKKIEESVTETESDSYTDLK